VSDAAPVLDDDPWVELDVVTENHPITEHAPGADDGPGADLDASSNHGEWANGRGVAELDVVGDNGARMDAGLGSRPGVEELESPGNREVRSVAD
jgi:hypothetical protein